MTLERRRDLRVAAGTYAELLVGGHSMGFFVIGDVSDSGLFLATPSPIVPAGQRIALRIEGQDLTLNGVIVHIMRGQQSGYGIQLDDPPNDTVERVVVARPPTSPPPTASAPAPAATPSAPTATASTRVVIIMQDAELGGAMATSLNAFRTSTVYLRPDADLIPALAKLSPVDVALVDAVTVSTRGPLTLASLKTHLHTRTLILYAHALPPAEERRQLQAAGVDQLWVAPLHPFEAMEKLQKRVRGR